MRIYFWVDGEVVESAQYPSRARPQDDKFYGCLCVDTGYPLDEPHNRYGMVGRPYNWVSVPKEEFPNEFLMHLLLLGVT